MAKANILVVSSNPSLCYHAQKDLVRQGFNVVVEKNTTVAITMLKPDTFDIVIASIKDSNLEENNIIQDLKNIKSEVLFIAVSDNYSLNSIENMARYGIFDFLPSAFEPKNLILRINQAIMFKRLKSSIKIHEERIQTFNKQIVALNNKVNNGIKSTSSLYKNLQESYIGSIKALAQAIDTRDRYTYSHSAKVTKYAILIAEEMKLSFQQIKDIRDACELHDIGKIGIKDSILSKKDKLTDEEWLQMKQHPLKGALILEHLGLKTVVELVKHHHEHFDGSGYPDGKKGNEILLGARVVSLADAYDAMVSERAYKHGHFSKQEAIEEIKKNSGKQFDPQVVEAFLKVVDGFE